MNLQDRIASIIEKGVLKPENILALTFTNKAALEMKQRTEKLLGEKLYRGLKISTFHRFCLDILRSEWQTLELPPDFIICSEEDSAALAQEAALDEGKPMRFAHSFSRELSRLKWQNVAGIKPEKGDEELLSIYEAYRNKLRAHQMLDLSDIEVEVYRLFRDFPDTAAKYSRQYQGIFVDEYQDTSPIQSAILKFVIKDDINSICAIGDPDQAIYKFRGADANNFSCFTKDFSGAEEIALSINYRSTENILRAASSVMKRERSLKGISGKGSPVLTTECATAAEEAEMVVEQTEKLLGGTSLFSLDSGRVASHEDGLELGFCDIAVLYRLNSQGDAFEEAFNRAGIPYIRSGESPLSSRFPANVILRFLQAMRYPGNTHFRNMHDALMQKYNLPAGLNFSAASEETGSEDLFDRILDAHGFDLSEKETKYVIDRLRSLADSHSENPAAFLDRLSLDRGIDHSALHGDRVNLMTVHAAKGLEWPVVFITGCEDGLFPLSIFGEYDEKEEKRLFYVGVTRAKQRLFLSRAKRRNINGRVIDMQQSPFLSMIPEDILAPVERSKWKPGRKKQTQLHLFS